VLESIVRHARDTQPAECCGILIGRPATIDATDASDELVTIVEAVPARNLAESPTRFLIDPTNHFDALRQARARGLDVIGFYHSHPATPPRPSPTDIAEASYQRHFHLIVSLASEPPAVGLYWLEDGRFTEVRK
jgi:proteasome lid subunit RPN8/RPN11